MPQFPIPHGTKIGQNVTLSSTDSRHLARVLRIGEGEVVRLFDQDHRYEGRVVSANPKGVILKVTTLLITQQLQGEVTLCPSILKGDKMDLLVQKAVELGVKKLVPVSSSRTIVAVPDKKKIVRWQKIADEALKQCGRIDRMTVCPAMPFKELIHQPQPDAVRILFAESGEKIRTGSSRYLLALGPEGGWTGEEIEEARRERFQIASLGPLTLRAETASIVAVTRIQHELGNL